MSFFEQLIAEAVRLAGAGGAGLLVVLVLLVGGALFVVLAKRVGGLKLPPPSPDLVEPPAVWNTDPKAGAVVVPNDQPGGGCEGG